VAPVALLLGLVPFLLGACGQGEGDADPAPAGEPVAERSTEPPPSLRDAAGAARDVLLITVDTLRWDALGFAGNREVATPALDQLAANGVVFEQARAHNVYTLPSHANILTGRLPFEHGIRDNAGFVLPASEPTIAATLRDAGFRTAAVVGAFPLDVRFGLGEGFDLYDDRYPEGGDEAFVVPERRGREVVEVGLRWWQEHGGARRFLWVHLYDPHAPYEAEEPWRSRYATRPYLGEVAAVDAYLAPLLDAVASSETLVVFTSDHGEGLGDHGEQAHGLFAYDSTLRVPLVLAGPGLAPGRTRWPVRHVDLVPTILEAVGVEAGPGISGRSLLGLPADLGVEPPPQYFESLSAALTRDWAPLRGVAVSPFKYIDLPLPELYDLSTDPDESSNLAEKLPDEIARLRALLPTESVWPPRASEVSAKDAAALQSLGYLVDSAAPRDNREYTAADDPKNLVGIDEALHRYIALYQARRYREATDEVRAVVQQRPTMPLAYYYLAQVLLKQERVPEALEVMLEAKRRGALSDVTRRQLGLTLTEVGRIAEAIETLGPLAETGDADGLAALGLAYSEAGDQERATRTLRRVFERDPRHPTAHVNLALAAVRQGRFREAETEARAALELNERLPQAWNLLGVSHYNQRRTGDALRAWERALEIEPGDYDVLYNFALVAAEAGERERALGAFRRFVAEAPPSRYGPDLDKARARLRALESR
jgi:choline-sulfatase